MRKGFLNDILAKAKIVTSENTILTSLASKSLKEKLKLFCVFATIVVIMFPPWCVFISRNGMTVKINGGHHFLITGHDMNDIDYKKLGLYVLLIWLIYSVSIMIDTFKKKKH